MTPALRVAGLVVVLTGSVLASPARALDDAALSALAAQLGSDDSAQRRDAYRALGSLGEADLPAIDARLERLRGARPVPEDALAILQVFRRATGSRRADDLVDVADGVLPALETRRDRDALRMAEPLLLLRSLERLGSRDALALVPKVLRLDPRAWEMEGRRTTLRLGDQAAGAVIRALATETSSEGRQWARWSQQELALDLPGRLVQRLGPRALADVLEAYGETRTMDAMPIVASFVDDARRGVREAARGSLRAYGQNAIWQTREQYRLRLGATPETTWGWERTLDELCAALDARRDAGVPVAVAEARTALDGGDLVRAAQVLDAALLATPGTRSPGLETALRDLATRLAQAGDEPGASRALRRADALSNDENTALPRFLEDERARSAGVIDVAAVGAATDCERCDAVRAELAALGARPTPSSGERRTVVLWLAAALVALLGAALFRAPRSPLPAVVDETDEPA